jgi:hypothetical protein
MAENSSPTLPSIKNRFAKFLKKDEIKKEILTYQKLSIL